MYIDNKNITFRGAFDPNILVTGASGYIGSNLVHNLTKNGYNCIISSRSPEKIKFLKKIVEEVNREKSNKSLCSFVNLDLLNHQEINDILQKNTPIDAVIHLAGATLNAESLKNPRKYYENNIKASINLTNSMLDSDINKILLISTGSTYGKIDNSFVNELSPQNPQTPYAKTKVMIEQLLKDYEIYNMKSTILRLFNIAGARSTKDLCIGQNIISVLMDKIKTNSLFTLFGGNYNTKDGTCIKDFLHVTDACDAIRLSLEKLLENNNNNIYNLGSGIGTSLGEIIHKTQNITGKNLQIRLANKLDNEVPEIVVDNSKIKEDLKWEPQYNIDDILTSAWNWTLKNR